MFTQKFRLGGRVVPVTWYSPRDGYVRVVSVGDRPAEALSLAELIEAEHACGQRMGECGEHKHEPKEEDHEAQ